MLLNLQNFIIFRFFALQIKIFIYFLIIPKFLIAEPSQKFDEVISESYDLVPDVTILTSKSTQLKKKGYLWFQKNGW